MVAMDCEMVKKAVDCGVVKISIVIRHCRKTGMLVKHYRVWVNTRNQREASPAC